MRRCTRLAGFAADFWRPGGSGPCGGDWSERWLDNSANKIELLCFHSPASTGARLCLWGVVVDFGGKWLNYQRVFMQ